MIKYILVFSLFLSISTYAEEPLKLEFENKNNEYLRLTITNITHLPVLMNKRFQYIFSSSMDPSEVKLEILDKDEQRIEYPSRFIEGDGMTRKHVILLFPGEVVGTDIPITTVMSYFNMLPGIYKVRAIYQNKIEFGEEFKDIYNGKLTSNWVTFKISRSNE